MWLRPASLIYARGHSEGMRAVFLLLAILPLSAGCATPSALAPEDECRLSLIVGFHEWPGLEAGDGYEGATVLDADEALRFIVVEPARWRAFMARATDDANVRYVEENQAVGIPENPPPPQLCPGSGFEPYYAPGTGPG